MKILFSILLIGLINYSEALISAEDVEKRVDDLINAMTVEEKVAQMFMVEIGSITPKEVSRYKIGAILNGGGSFPYKKKDHAVNDWVRLADEYFSASITENDELNIPIIWGTDAVHGHNNLKGCLLYTSDAADE